MATNIVFGIVGGISGPNSHRDILRQTAAETIVASGTSQQSTNVAQNPGQGSSSCPAASINTDADVWIAYGPNPTAVANTCRMLLAGQMCDVYLNPGDKVAILLKS